MRIVLISTYELGRQPFGLASPAAWLRDAGAEVTCVDLTRGALPEESVRDADLVAFFLPMHTATRMALPVIDRVRSLNPSVRLCAYGLYAPLNETLLRERGVETVLGPEFEEDLVAVACGTRLQPRPDTETTETTLKGRTTTLHRTLPRISFKTPDRAGLPALEKYARLRMPDGTTRTVGYTEASRGCKHLCRHCPIVPVYDGRFRAVPADVVLADVRAQVGAGAGHITFGDPGLLQRRHARAAHRSRAGARASGAVLRRDDQDRAPDRSRRGIAGARGTGCAFITSAVESIDDDVLAKLKKGHTRADFERAVTLCREARLPLAPTFVTFTPWTTKQSYVESARRDRAARSGRARPADPAGDQAARDAGVAAAGIAGDPRGSPVRSTRARSRIRGGIRIRSSIAFKHGIETLVGRNVAASRRQVFEAVRALADPLNAEGRRAAADERRLRSWSRSSRGRQSHT